MRLYTSKVIADWLGLTERRVRQLRDEGIIEEQAPGLYDLRATTRCGAASCTGRRRSRAASRRCF